MRIATWNVNSLKARQEAVEKWLERAAPDVLLMQETKLSDDDAPVMAFAMAGYELVHHGEGRWNGVAIAVRDGLSIGDVVTNFGDGPVRDSGAGRDRRRGHGRRGLRPVRRGADAGGGPSTASGSSASTRRTAASSDSPFYTGKLRLVRAARAAGSATSRRSTSRTARWSSAATSTSPRPTPTSGTPAPRTAARTCREPERAAFRRLLDVGPGRRVPVAPRRAAAASRGGTTARACSTRTSGCGSTTCS